ncbi:hypothetical protein GS488_06115 [Rhodococcus hoagii]|nr:hypothetical protein [Prescottella equi]
MDGDLTDIVLYAFSCGYDCILTGGPVPAFGEASTYVEQIKSKVTGQP